MSDRTLVIIRGNSGSGKTTSAREVRARYGRGCALIEQDHFRRIVLREHDASASEGIAPGFIANAARYALDNGYHVVLEGILFAARYGEALRDLIGGHTGPSHVFYLDVSHISGLPGTPATTWCPAVCPRCHAAAAAGLPG